MANKKQKLAPSLNHILTALMNECDIDDARLSRETGIPASTISRMRLNPDANPTASSLRPIARYFDLSISQLLGDEPLPEERIPGTYHSSSFTISKIPIISWDLVLPWVENEQPSNLRKIESWISSEKEVDKASFSLVIPTESFGLTFRKGSIIIIDPSKSPKDCDMILLYLLEDKTILLRQYLKDGQDEYIKSVNPEMKGTQQLTTDYKIIGVVIETRFYLHREGIDYKNASSEKAHVNNKKLVFA